MDSNELGKAKYGKSSVEAELSVLGSMMLEAVKIDEVVAVLNSDDFSDQGHGLLFSRMKSMRGKGIDVDVISLLDESNHYFKLGYLTNCLDKAPPGLRIVRHIDIILRESKRRQHAMRLVGFLEEVDQSDDLDATISRQQAEIDSIDSVSTEWRAEQLGIAEMRVYERIAEQRETGIIPGIPTGFRDFDDFVGGMHPGDLVILAARPGMGKTAIALQIARSVSLRDVAVAMFSIEMPIEQLALRRISSAAEIDHSRLRRAQISDYEMDNMLVAIEDGYETPLYIDSDVTVTVGDLYSRCKRIANFSSTKPLGLVLVDYLQKIRATDRVSDNRTLDVGNAARGMKTLARQLQVPVIALAQINRMAEGRQDKRPMISDLGESGAIEAEADQIIMLYRESYYAPKGRESVGLNPVDEVELIVGKCRNGRTGTVKVGFEGQFVRFSDLDTAKLGEPTGF